MKQRLSVLLTCWVMSALAAHAQQGDSLSVLPSSKYLQQVAAKSGRLEQKLDRKSEKALRRFQKQETRIQRKLAKTDSVKAKAIFSDVKTQYAALDARLQNSSLPNPYQASLDTLASSLQFLQQNSQFIVQVKDARQKLGTAIDRVDGLGEQFRKADKIKKFLKQRREYLRQQLVGTGTGGYRYGKQLKQLSKTSYYYSEQVNEYKELLKDHTKAEKKAIALLSKTRVFQNFLRKNSQLASLFRLPGDPNDPVSQASLAGLQTRISVTNLIQQQLGAGGPNAQAQFQQNMRAAQSQLNQLKNKLTKLGKSSSDDEMPEGFMPNHERVKSFLKRLQLGTNIQSQRAGSYLPACSDIGISIGYRLNKTVIGIGGSYKIGWGKDIRHLHISHQGASIRAFADLKLKGSFWISGGYELNYKAAFRNIDQLKDLAIWQQSALIGMSKVISMKTKFFKQTKLQLLWDFLSYRQIPRAQPVVFRIGYMWN